MTDQIPPLQAISQKELELRRRLEAAHRQAEARLQAAQAEVEKIIAQAERDGRAEAEAIFQRGVAEARQQAEAIVAAAHTEAAALRARVLPRLEQMADRIVELVLPAGDPNSF